MSSVLASCTELEFITPDAGPGADLGGDGAIGDDMGFIADIGPNDMSIVLDAGAVPDTGFPPGQDTDGDGLCDSREAQRGTNIMDPDTDSDGFTDYYEFIAGMDPSSPSSPEAEDLFFLVEQPGVTLTAPVRRRVFAGGEDYSGAFVAIRVSDVEGIGSENFYVDSRATSAIPAGNAAFVDAEQERYFGVIGSTELGFEIDFEVPSGLLPRGCLRVYPFRYDIKRSDGALVAVERRFIVMVPEGGSLGSSAWCHPGFCI